MDEEEFVTDIQIRYGDVDALGHVNNATYLAYYELARINFINRFGYGNLSHIPGIVIARAEVDFLKPIQFETLVKVGTRILKVGRTSITFQHRIFDIKGNIYSRALIIGVFVDDNGRPVNVPSKIVEFYNQTGVVT